MEDKKKLMILGSLGVVLLGIGAFTFVKGSGAPPAADPAAASASTPSVSTVAMNSKQDAAVPAQQNNLVTGSYPVRDPFKPLVDANPPAPVPQTSLPTHVGTTHLPIDTMPGTLPPMGSSVGNGTTTPVTPPAPQYGYRLAGVIVGQKPAAVFIDAQGVQHLIQLGGKLDGDTQLVDLDKNHVVLRVKDQTKTLTLGGGDSSAK